jgi:Tfp pilus assembly protein PilF
LTEALQLCGGCAESAHLHHNLGLFYGKTGKVEEAKKELQTAIALDPNDADAQKALVMLQSVHTAQAQ